MIARALRGLAAATVLLAAVSAVADAQAATPARFAVYAGVGMPMGDFGNGFDMGIHAGGSWQRGLGKTASLRVNADFGTYGASSGVDASIRMLGGMVNAVMPAGKAYVLGGLGMVNTSVDVGGLSASSTDLAFNVGGGMNFALGTKSAFVEARYLSIQGDGGSLNTLPITFGIRF